MIYLDRRQWLLGTSLRVYSREVAGTAGSVEVKA